MSENPLISVIIPVYNVKEFLHACVECITAQTYTNLEILMSDEKLRDTLVQNANKRTQDFSIETIGKKWTDFINSSLEQK